MLSRRTVLAGLAALSACKKNEPPMATPDPDREKKVLARLEPWRRKHARTAWRPELGTGEGPHAGSRMGGTPWLAENEEWPKCGACKHPLQLFVQLDNATLPKKYGEGLIQLFYCVNERSYPPIAGLPPPPVDACTAADYEAFSPAHLVRLVGAAKGRRGTAPARLTPYPERPVQKWTAFTEGPEPGEHEALGLRHTYDFQAKTVRITCPELKVDEAGLPYDFVETISNCQQGDKLAGWPRWIQGVEYPSCPKCSTRMDLVFQVDSEKGIPYMFGDVGIGHVTQCPQHPDVLAFAWACS